MFDFYLREFMAVVSHFIEKENGVKKPDYLYIKKQDLISALNKNSYDTAQNKLLLWRGLQWIDSDIGRLTKRVSIGGKSIPMIKIRLQPYETIKSIHENKP